MASTRAPSLQLRRHDVVHLHPSRCPGHDPELTAADHTAVCAWIDAGRPFVARRQEPAAVARGRVCLGLPLPPSAGKRRVAVQADRTCVSEVAPPPLLRECLRALPSVWREPLKRLDASARDARIVLRVFGSVAFQSLTGLSYLLPASDVDLLWAPDDRCMLDAGVRLLVAWEQSSGLRADGEILFAQHGVSWREWLGGSPRVLAKSNEGPALLARDGLVALLEARPPFDREPQCDPRREQSVSAACESRR